MTVQIPNSRILYSHLASAAKATNLSVAASHNSLFSPTEHSEKYYQTLYESQLDYEDGKQSNRPGDHTCRYCNGFHLSNLKKINKSSDIALGSRLESIFQQHIVETMHEFGFEIVCDRADNPDLHMPDFKVIDKSTNRPILFFEFKVIFRPFLKIAQFVNSKFECYSHSLTLDLSNGNKLEEQRTRVEDQIGTHNTIYVYWYDLPCIKGIFWWESSKVYDLMDEQIAYDRRKTSGDYNSYGRKTGSTKKLYLPLLKMNDFQSFFSLLAGKL